MPNHFITRLVFQIINFYYYILIIRIFLSWIQTIDWDSQPFAFISAITDPFLNIFRGIIPPIGGMLDISPILAFLALWLVQNFVISFLFGLGL